MGLHQRAGHSVVCVTALLCLRIHTAGYCKCDNLVFVLSRRVDDAQRL